MVRCYCYNLSFRSYHSAIIGFHAHNFYFLLNYLSSRFRHNKTNEHKYDII
uniref:Uncharacterized protein n=1 Tax=Polysiphonia sp. TaxID=1967842 RepID=A0A1Z1M3W4_9FLOR|nr:hypothetical protein [Polysiphonia sp.]